MVLIGIAGFGTWALITIVRSAFAKGEARLAVAAFAALAVGLVIILVVSGKGAYWISLYRWTPGWAIETANEIGHYEGRLIIPYPTLWTLFPVAGLLAIKRQRDAGLMCLIVFATGLGLHSFAAPKADRFFAYLLPFFFAMWGFALAEILPQINRLATHVIRIVIGAAAPDRLTRTFAVTLLAAVISFTLVSNPAFLQMYRIASGSPMARWQSPNWNAASDTLKSLFAQSSVVVTPNSVHALYYLGRYDLEFRRTAVYETFSSSEFGIDPRTGRPNISTLESLQLVMSCYPTGVFITENLRWRNSMEGINDEAADFLIANSEEIVLKPEWYIRAFRWDRSPTTPSQPDCSRTRGARR